MKAQRIVVEDTVPYKVEGPTSDYMYHIKKGQVNGICGVIMYIKHRVQKGTGRDKYFEWEKKPSHFFPNSFDVANTLVMTLRRQAPVRGATGVYHMTYGDFVIFTIDMSKEDMSEKLGEFLSKKPVAYRIM